MLKSHSLQAGLRQGASSCGNRCVCPCAHQAPPICRSIRCQTAKRFRSFGCCQSALDYKAAGVDIDAGNELVRRIKKMNPAIGGFSGMVPFGDHFLVAGTDGVGTKLKLAFELGKHDTIGIDLVAMSVNDIITSGAKPLFFLDYYATGQLDVDVAEAVVKGIVEGCRQSDCILLGGETAEMPGFYSPGEYDVAGFAVGAVKQDAVIDGSRIRPGDKLVGLPSSGIHSNGFSLVRKVIQRAGVKLQSPVSWGQNCTFGEAMLTPTTIYVKPLLTLSSRVDVKGLVHITGGGFPENIPRVFPGGVGCRIDRSSWQVPDLFQWVQQIPMENEQHFVQGVRPDPVESFVTSPNHVDEQEGGIADAEMFRTFNMGIGMVAIVDAAQADQACQMLPGSTILGDIVEGSGVDLQL